MQRPSKLIVKSILYQGGNYSGIPSMYSPEHIRAWKKITDAVHAEGGYMFCQLWHVSGLSYPGSVWEYGTDA
jgi:N-ethylmaleimide reductase